MLDKQVDEIVYENGVASGVRSGDEIAKAKIIIGDPSYFPGKVRKVGKVIRAICLLQHPIPNTDNVDSVQLIIPQNQVGRRHGTSPPPCHRALANLDIYIAEVSAAHNVCAKNHYLAIVSTVVETDNPHVEIKPGLDLLGPILDK
jgi:Rab GDP dissociation inhibitor